MSGSSTPKFFVNQPDAFEAIELDSPEQDFRSSLSIVPPTVDPLENARLIDAEHPSLRREISASVSSGGKIVSLYRVDDAPKSWWQKFKEWCGANKYKLIIGGAVCVLIAIAGVVTLGIGVLPSVAILPLAATNSAVLLSSVGVISAGVAGGHYLEQKDPLKALQAEVTDVKQSNERIKEKNQELEQKLSEVNNMKEQLAILMQERDEQKVRVQASVAQIGHGM